MINIAKFLIVRVQKKTGHQVQYIKLFQQKKIKYNKFLSI